MTWNPLIFNLRYTIPSLSIAEWGDYPLPGVDYCPEYYFYTQFFNASAPNLTYSQVITVTDAGYSWYGLANSFNAKYLASEYAA